MKKLLPKDKVRKVRHLLAKRRTLATRAEKLADVRSYFTTTPVLSLEKLLEKYPDVKVTKARDYTSISAPKVMRLSLNNDEVMQFLNFFRDIIKHPIKNLRLDFTTIETLSPLCAMLLATEVHRWKLTKLRRMRVIDSDKWKPEIKRLLADIGIFNLIPVVNPYHKDLENVETDEKFITLRSAQFVDLEKAISEIETQVAAVGTLFNNNPHLYGGIEEAVTNVLQWAYKFGFEEKIHPAILNRWWFLSSYNIKTKRITIMVYDHGIGIPKTLPASKWKENFRKWMDATGLKEWKDHEIIEAAIKFPRSASGKSYRAKGLRKMKELLAKFSKGTLFIYSGHGEYQIKCNGTEKKVLHKNPIGGTLIVWEVYAESSNI